jgi:hypothetical protein
MNCYRHQQSPAVGTCKTCCKGLCPECAADVGNGLACRGQCETKVGELNQMWERSARIYGIGTHKTRVPQTGVLLWGLMALAMWVFTGFQYFSRGEVDIAGIIVAAFFTAALGIALYSARRTGLNC